MGAPSLRDPVAIGALRLRNRLYRAPVLEGAGRAKDPAAEYARHFVPGAAAGLGLIVQGNTIVLPHGRTSPGMSAIGARDHVLALAPMVRAVHDAGGAIAIQLGHGGIFALESWHREFASARSVPPFAPSPIPLWMRAVLGRVRVLATGEVEDLVRRFGLVASWAREAGYDAVQLAGANAKLLHQFLSPTYNRRDDRYGGSPSARFRILREIRASIAEQAGGDFPVLLKLAAEEHGVFGRRWGLDLGIDYARMAEDAGFDAITPVVADSMPNTAICRGAYPAEMFAKERITRMYRDAGGRKAKPVASIAARIAARRYPFTPVWNREAFRAVKMAVRVPIFAVGGIRSRAEAAEILARGEADLVGVGRPFYAEPELARRFLDDGAPDGAACENSNNCVVAQMLGMPAACYNSGVHKKLAAARS